MTDCADLRSQMQRACRGATPRDELEHLMADVSAEILLLEVALRRNEQELLRAMETPEPPGMQAKVDRRTRMRDEVAELRMLAGEIRACLTRRP